MSGRTRTLGAALAIVFAVAISGAACGDPEPAQPLRAHATADGDPLPGRSVAFSSDGKTLIVGTADGSLVFYDADTRGALATVARAHPGPVGIAGPPGKVLTTVGADGVRQWNPVTRQAVGEPVPTDLADPLTRTVAVSPDGTRLTTGLPPGTGTAPSPCDGSGNDAIRLTDLTRRTTIADITGFSSVVNAAFAPDGATVALAVTQVTANATNCTAMVANRMIVLWDVAAGRATAVAAGRFAGSGETANRAYSRVLINPAGTRLVAGLMDGAVELYNLVDRVQIHGYRIVLDLEAVSALAYRPDGKILAVGGAKGQLQLVDTVLSLELGNRFGTGGSMINQLAWSPDGRRLASATGDGHVQLWTITSTGG